MNESQKPRVIIVGAGIGGLTLALALEQRGIRPVVLEAAPELRAVGVGINLLPHCTAVLHRLGLEDAITAVAVTTKESVFYTRFGQLAYSEPAGRYAGFHRPQFSIHRGDLQLVLRDALVERCGPATLLLDHRVIDVEQDGGGARVHAVHADGHTSTICGDVVIAADGVNSVVRKQLYPDSAPHYTGYMMWRGTTIMPPFLSGASMVRAGWFSHGKMVIYPIRDNVNDRGDQLVNWVAEVEAPMIAERDWNSPGKADDFIGPFEDWAFDWIDVPAMIRGAEQILQYPMVDQEPLPRWTQGRLSLLGDAAHPMVPRGSNGAAQAILDAEQLAGDLATTPDPMVALQTYEAVRRPATERVVLTNRTTPPDSILRAVHERSGDRPFERIEDVISGDELERISAQYRAVVGISTP